ncbi:hypothetical protein CBS101457_003435 [Exobasidium rhododendri]|nr:hypothetical protein CBS101457_003435 [Exobasidium rhododendri]
MQFLTSSAIVAAIVAAAMSATPVSAADDRQLYTYSGGDGVAFCKSWKCACINYVPTNTALTFQTANCNPGDYSGNNKNTEALAFCSFTDGKTTTLVNKHVASATGATLA